jgi:hypothetical protein
MRDILTAPLVLPGWHLCWTALCGSVLSLFVSWSWLSRACGGRPVWPRRFWRSGSAGFGRISGREVELSPASCGVSPLGRAAGGFVLLIRQSRSERPESAGAGTLPWRAPPSTYPIYWLF